MRVLIVHNRYQQRGGEDAVVDAEAQLLSSRGFAVERFEADNDSIQKTWDRVRVSVRQFTGSSGIENDFLSAAARFRPDIVHVHNWFPTISADIFKTCKRAGLPVVHTLHNFRLLCVGATLFRNGGICEDCIGTTFRTPGILGKCYRGSTLGSAVGTAGMLSHWSSGVWHHSVDVFVALTEFARAKFIDGGLPADKITVKPNFVDPPPHPGHGDGNYFLFAGRLSEEKGIKTLLDCWERGPELPVLRIAGVGPLSEQVRSASVRLPNVEWLGLVTGAEVSRLMERAIATVCPSLWYEGMPRVVIESLAVGTPVVASDIGGYPEMIVEGECGMLFTPGNVGALLSRIQDLIRSRRFLSMRSGARQRYMNKYTGEDNFAMLANVYRQAMRSAAANSPLPEFAGEFAV